MIRITIELVPYGDESRRKIIGTGEIVNDGTGTKAIGNYRYWLSDGNGVFSKGSVENFPRLSGDCWDLLKYSIEGRGDEYGD